jgi:hypothetical protein
MIGDAGVPAGPETIKWAVFRDQLDASCWTRVGVDPGGSAIWALADGWRDALFGGAYQAVIANAQASPANYSAVTFVRHDGIHEIRVASGVAPGAHYDLRWVFGAQAAPDEEGLAPCGGGDRRLAEIRLSRGDQPVAAANAVWLIAPSALETDGGLPGETTLRIYCQQADETIDLVMPALKVLRQHSPQQAQAQAQAQWSQVVDAFQPWRAVLYWMGALKRIDGMAYGRIPRPIRGFLDSRPNAYEALTPNVVAAWQSAGLLPAQPSQLTSDAELETVRAAIALQKSLAGQQTFLIQFQNVSPIPRLVTAVDPQQMNPVDARAFMTIGALRELHGTLQQKLDELKARDPRLRMRIEGPNGKRQLLQDPRMAALRADPAVMREIEEEQDLAARRQGAMGPTNRDALRMMNRMQGGGIGGGMGGGMEGLGAMGPALVTGLAGPMAGMAALMYQNSVQNSCPPDPGQPPWKIYEPYIC